jgi:class 3 adenylate cyclase/DNA-binding NarL/FixJ family response regulator
VNAELPSGTLTFLFTDIEGSTRLLAQLGDRFSEVLSDHQQLLRDAFAAAGGREIDTQGDAFLAVFPRAKDAVAAALAGQRSLATHSWPPDVDVQVRMSLHTGEPAAARERYIGLSVHRAARICAVAHGGQILQSRATHAILADDLLPDITFQDLGEHRLKDLDHAERIYQLLVPDLPRHFPPLRTISRLAPGQLTHTEFLHESTETPPSDGRRPLRVAVADDSVLLREGLSRLLTDAGFDVVAKAADADELMRQVRHAHPDVVLTDIKMPPAHIDEGILAAMEIRRLHPRVGVLVLSQYLDTEYALRLLDEYPERVGYLLKDRVYDVAVLSDGIRRVAEGECVVEKMPMCGAFAEPSDGLERRTPPLEEGSERVRKGLLKRKSVASRNREGTSDRARACPHMTPVCLIDNSNAGFAGTFAKPSDGLEPSTPSLP